MLNAQAELERAKQVPAPELERRISAVVRLFRSRTEAAIAAGISTDQLARYEKGAAPSFPPLAKLAIAKGVSLDWLATGAGSMYGEPPEAAPNKGSHPTRLDRDILREAVKLLRAIYDLAGARYDVEEDPDVLIETYLFLTEHEGNLSHAEVIDLSKRLADRRRAKEADHAKRQGEPGSATR